MTDATYPIASSQRLNQFGQPVGEDVPNWKGANPAEPKNHTGQYCRLEPLDQKAHAEDLYRAFMTDQSGKMWTYMPVGPFGHFAELETWMAWACASKDPLFFAVINQKDGHAIGFASLMRIDPSAGSIEVGYIAFSPLLQRTPMATEAMFLLMQHAFDDLGYRRYEWKCDNLNEASKNAAKRLGFSYDGLFRQALVYKGRNRDTAWFSVLDCDWPRLKAAFET